MTQSDRFHIMSRNMTALHFFIGTTIEVFFGKDCRKLHIILFGFNANVLPFKGAAMAVFSQVYYSVSKCWPCIHCWVHS